MTVLGVLEWATFWGGCFFGGGRKGGTYDADGPDEDIGGVGLGVDHLGDEVCGHTDDGDEGDTLETAGDGVGCAEGAVLGSGHSGFFGERVG